MSRRPASFAIAMLLASASAHAQQLRTYTQSETGPQFLTYGLPVPIPIDSLTPVEGFRTYAAVQARLQALALESPDLAAHDVGRTTANRTVWAYVTGDDDAVDVEGRPEAAFFINASTHAREWAAPEVSTGTIERLVAGANDAGMVRYLLDNTRLVIIPVHNIDGVLQTHRYPTDVLVGQDPDFPADWPRDGRMRRKNMRGVDEVLSTTGDHLLGVDLNRNHPPFWATSQSSSSNPNSLVFHGAGPHTEPENQALLAAARLAPESRIRLGIDVHTFSKVFFSSNTARGRLNNIQRNLITRMINHHQALAGTRYTDVPDPPNRGIGAAAEYFSYQWLVPGWTLELEPSNDATEYGGTGVTHGGFILPASQARRVREGWAETHLLAFYLMSGPPHLARVRYVDAQTGAIALQTRWRYDAASARRERLTDVPGTLVPGRRYRAELGFSKPMRWRDAQGNVAPIPGQALAVTPPAATLIQGTARTTLDTGAGTWLTDPARVLRYRDDTFAFEFTAPSTLGDFALEVATADLANANLDADPSTPADWDQGAWSEYEGIAGNDGDLGGADRSTTFSVQAAAAAQVSVLTADALAGEGDGATLRVNRAAGAGRLELRRTDVQPPPLLATWEAGQTGERSIVLDIADDTPVQGDRNVVVPLAESVDGGAGATLAAPVQVLDNDDAIRSVQRIKTGTALAGAWTAATPAPLELVLDAGTDYAPITPVSVQGRVTVHGNGAHLVLPRSTEGTGAVRIAAGAEVTFDRLRIVAPRATAEHAQPALENAGTLRVTRSLIGDFADGAGTLLVNRGELTLERSVLGASAPEGLVQQMAGHASVLSTTLSTQDAAGGGGPAFDMQGGSVDMRQSTLIAYPLSTGPAAAQLRVRTSAVMERYRSGVAAPPDFTRAACGAPLLASQGGNVFSAQYEGGDGNQILAGGCLAPIASDVFDPDLAFVPFNASDEPQIFAPQDSAALEHIAAADCAVSDVRGAPRPQNTNGGVVAPRCEAGAYEVGVNPYRGIWSPARSGHGVDIQTAGNMLFLAWYTYEDDGEPTAYQAAAPFTGPHWETALQQSSRDPQTGVVSVRSVGRVSIDFTDDTHATLGWRFDARGTNGSEAITAFLFAPGAPRFEVTGLWYPPADSGHGATISRRGEVTALGVYYYDAAGNVRWALGTGSAADAQRFAMTSFRGFCPDCNAAANPVTGTPAGNALVHFHTPRQARVELQLSYPGAAGGTWNRAAARFVPINDAVDNTDALRPDATD